MQGANGYYAYVVKPDNTVERRVVEVAGTQDGIAVDRARASPPARRSWSTASTA